MFSLVKESLLGFIFFFFNDTATTEIYTLSLHDALPIFPALSFTLDAAAPDPRGGGIAIGTISVGLEPTEVRSEEHTSELQSQSNLVCRLLLEKKKSLSLPLRMEDHHFFTSQHQPPIPPS